MTPEFALDLSHDGISLLRRADDGWRRFGAVSLDADRLADDLAGLKQKAEASGGDLKTKLVIPNSQILFTTCPASGKDALADEVRVRATLEGATPYEVSDLVFDWESDGDRLHVAVVARETLEEARDFAREHGFGPMGYVAVPPRGAFLREPFFGPVARGPGAGPAMLADAEPIEVVGDWAETKAGATETVMQAAIEPAPAAEPAPETGPGETGPETDPGAERPALEIAAKTSGGIEEPLDNAAAKSGAQDRAESEPTEGWVRDKAMEATTTAGAMGAADPEEASANVAAEEEPAMEATTDAPDRAAGEKATVTGEVPGEGEVPAGVAAEQAATEPPAEAPAPIPSFSSIRTTASEGRAPKLGGARRNETPASPPEKKAGRQPQASAPAAPPEALAATLRPVPAANPAPVPALDAPEIAPQNTSPPSNAAFAAFRDRVAGLRRPTDKGALTPEIIAAPLPRPAPQDLPEQVSQEASDGEFTIFGARGKAKSKQGRRFPIGLTVGLVLFLGMVGLWSKLFLASENTAAEAPARTEQMIASASATAVPLRGGDGALTRSITFSETGTSGATADTESEADLADALKAPVTETDDPGNPVDLASLTDDPFSALPEEEPQLTEPMFEIAPLPEIDADAASAADDLAEMEPEPELATAEPLTPEEAQAAYAETGVWQQSPAPAPLPGEDSTDDIYIASIDPSVRPLDAVALPRAGTGGGSDAALPPQPSPMPPGQVVEFDDDGSIRPTEEGVVTGEGVTLYSGRPGVVPRPRAGGAGSSAPSGAEATAAPATEEAGADSRVVGARPRPRPAGLVEESEKAQLGGRTRAEMAGLRPRQRPHSVQDQAEETRQAAIEEAVRNSAEEALALQQSEERTRAEAELNNASRLAVASSRSPAARPRDLERKAETARTRAVQETAAKEQPTRTAAAAAVMPRNQRVAPKVPTSASVAKAATDTNALKLRDVNLIGVFGSPAQRRALVRLPSGRLVKVKPGDRLDGGKVAAIGQNELRYVKRGRNITLSMPRG